MHSIKKLAFLLSICLLIGSASFAQTQEDFQKKYTEIFENTADKNKALNIAKEAHAMLEKQPSLQTYTNYYILKSVFENQAPDEKLAKQCADKADKLLRATVCTATGPTDYGSDSLNLWYNKIYKSLYETTDPENANNALAFLDQYKSYQTFFNYGAIAYALERNGDFNNAKKYYEHSLTLVGDDKKDYHSYLSYILFLSKYGDYQRAEEFIRKIETLATTATDIFKDSYKAEAITAHSLYSYYTGDYESYLFYSKQQWDFLSKTFVQNKIPCGSQAHSHLTNTAMASEQLKQYDAAEKQWKSRDSAYNKWVNCQREQYPNLRLYDFSMYPVFLYKRGKEKLIPKPVNFYIDELKTYYNSFAQYADVSANFFKASQLAFLKSVEYKNAFTPVLERIRATKDFRESTYPFASFAYFTMRDGDYTTSQKNYTELFTLNEGWINDIIFTFGERAFVTYYNYKLKEGYDNFHSFVKLSKEKNLTIFPLLAAQAYDNLLFTKSISLQGTQKRKEAFVKSNDTAIAKLYNQWLDKKQQLIRQYFKAAEPDGAEKNKMDNVGDELSKLQTEVINMENELTNKAKDFKKLLTIKPPHWQEVQSRLQPGEAAVEIIKFQWRNQVYYSDSSYYAAYIITHDSKHPDVIYLPASPVDMDNKFYKQYKSSINLKIEDNVSYNNYWQPIAEKIKGTTKVYFSPDGIYHLINIATLKNPTTGKYVLDEINIQLTTSTNDVAINEFTDENKTAVLFGRPSYKTNSKTGAGASAGNTRAFVNDFKDKNITDLPGTEEEVNSIVSELKKNKFTVKSYLKDDATEDKLHSIKNSSILHIATHGYWAGTNNSTEGFRLFNAMANSGLLLTGVVNYYNTNPYPNSYDGILTAYEAQNLDLSNTSLVVLSACETSLGYLDAGEGVYGLQRAFRAAGAHSIITSLWKVDDNATKDFMITFYQQYLSQKNKQKAFFYAQKVIQEKYKHPYYWGAFVMVGK